MRKILLSIGLALLIFAFASNDASAQQKGEFALGANINLGTLIPTVGIGLNAQYNFSDEIRVVGNLDYFIKNNYLSTFDVTFDAHYVFALNDWFALYPLFGMGFSVISTKVGDIRSSRTPFVANIGGGCQFTISEKFRINFEIKGRLGRFASQAVIGPTFLYVF